MMDSKAQVFLVLLAGIACTLGEEIRWCVLSQKEHEKCQRLSEEVTKKAYSSGINKVDCVKGQDDYDCLELIDKNEADIVSIDAGVAYYASTNFVSTLLTAEIYGDNDDSYYSVALVSKSSDQIRGPFQLKQKRLCSTGVGEIAGWTLPLSRLAEEGVMPVTECNVNVKTAASFFSSMCAPGALNTYNNPFGDNPVSSCQECGSQGSGRCSYKDKYANSTGAFMCLAEGHGDVAFMKSIDAEYLTTPHSGTPAMFSRANYELLCPQGGRANIGEYSGCNWGRAAADVIVTSGARSVVQQREYRDFVMQLSLDFGPLPDSSTPVVPTTADPNSNETTVATTAAPTLQPNSDNDQFSLFNSDEYGMNALVSSTAKKFRRVSTDGFRYVGEGFQAKLDALQSCAVSSVRICVASEFAMTKCEQMLLAARSKALKPEFDCILDNTTRNCMRKIADDDADLIVLDAGDVYEAGRNFDLVPIANENYGDTGNFYYAVAVSRKIESHLTLFNLIARNSCHGSMRSATGWIYPVLSLMETGQISPDKCGAIKSVGELFRQSCVPGILNREYDKAGTNPVNLCENCASGGMDKCQRNTRELYYGDSGAFRCLVENGGDIAFVRHMTARDNTDGRNADYWARNRRSDDYELLCKNGRRASITQWENCYLAKVPAQAVVTASHKTPAERKIFWNLLNYAQQFFSADSNPYFTMFDSGVNQDDLLFSDSTVRLVEVPEENQFYDKYLGEPFLKAVNTLNIYDCTSNAMTLTKSLLIFSTCMIIHKLTL